MNLSWLPYALIIQLFLTWFAPPISVGSRLLFLGDLWTFAWVGFAFICLLRDRARRGEVRKYLAWAALILVIFVHGAARPSLILPLSNTGLKSLPDDTFNLVREFVVSIRFISWIWAAFSTAQWFSTRSKTRIQAFDMLQNFLAVGMILSSTSLIVSCISPSILDRLGELYHYNPHAFPWDGRMYGIFRSPIEAAMSLGLGIPLLLIRLNRIHSPVNCAVRIFGIIGAFAAISLSRTLTPIAGWFAVPLILLSLKIRGFAKVIFIALCTASLGAIFYFLKMSSDWRIHQKYDDLLFRLGPWKVFWDTAAARWDYLLLGLGFPDYYVDNIYVFLFNRGGILLFGSALACIGLSLWQSWKHYGWQQKACIIYLFVSGLVIDAWIIRPVVSLWITIGVAALMMPQSEKPGVRSST